MESVVGGVFRPTPPSTDDEGSESGSPAGGLGLDPTSVMWSAASNGNPTLFTQAIASGASLDHVRNGYTAMHMACLHGNTVAVDVLCEAGADHSAPVEGWGCTALFLAAHSGFLDIVRILLRAQAAVDVGLPANRCTPLYVAAEHGHVDVMQELIGAGADVNCMAASGTSALGAAALAGHEDAVAALAGAGADVHAPMSNGATAMHLAVLSSQVGTVEQLYIHGANVTAQIAVGDGTSVSAVELAKERGQTEMVDALNTCLGTTFALVRFQARWRGRRHRQLLKRQEEMAWEMVAQNDCDQIEERRQIVSTARSALLIQRTARRWIAAKRVVHMRRQVAASVTFSCWWKGRAARVRTAKLRAARKAVFTSKVETVAQHYEHDSRIVEMRRTHDAKVQAEMEAFRAARVARLAAMRAQTRQEFLVRKAAPKMPFPSPKTVAAAVTIQRYHRGAIARRRLHQEEKLAWDIVNDESKEREQAHLSRQFMEQEHEVQVEVAKKQRAYEAEQARIAARLLASILTGGSQEDWRPILEELDDADMMIEPTSGRRTLHVAVAKGNTQLAEVALSLGASSLSTDKSGCSALDLARQLLSHHRRREDRDPKRKDTFEQMLILLEHEGLTAEATDIGDDFAASLAVSQVVANQKMVSLERSGILDSPPPPPQGPPNGTLAKILTATRRPEFDKLFDSLPSKRAAFLDQLILTGQGSTGVEQIVEAEPVLPQTTKRQDLVQPEQSDAAFSADVMEADATIASIELAMLRSTATLVQLSQPLFPPTPPKAPTPELEPEPVVLSQTDEEQLRGLSYSASAWARRPNRTIRDGQRCESAKRQLRASHILLEGHDLASAHTLLDDLLAKLRQFSSSVAQAQDPEKQKTAALARLTRAFDESARRLSCCSFTKDSSGDLGPVSQPAEEEEDRQGLYGWWSPNIVPLELSQAFDGLQIGQLSGVVETERGLHVCLRTAPYRDPPAASPPKGPKWECEVLHILIKHRESGKKSSWRDPSGRQIALRSKADTTKMLRNLAAELQVLEGDQRVTQLRMLAKQWSDCPSAKAEGEHLARLPGHQTQGKMMVEFERALLPLISGDLSDVVETRSGSHLMLLLSRRPGLA